MNAANASQAGLRLGAYIYSYATSVEMAQQEADFVLNLIKDYPISFPVVFDAEDAMLLLNWIIWEYIYKTHSDFLLCRGP